MTSVALAQCNASIRADIGKAARAQFATCQPSKHFGANLHITSCADDHTISGARPSSHRDSNQRQRRTIREIYCGVFHVSNCANCGVGRKGVLMKKAATQQSPAL